MGAQLVVLATRTTTLGAAMAVPCDSLGAYLRPVDRVCLYGGPPYLGYLPSFGWADSAKHGFLVIS